MLARPRAPVQRGLGHQSAFGESVVQFAAKVRTRRRTILSACAKIVLRCAVCIFFSELAFAKDVDDGSDGGSKTPTIYLDMRTTYAAIPAGSLPIGFGNSALSSAVQALALRDGTTIATVPSSVSLPSRQAIAVDLPLTVDVTDKVSLYAGISATTTFASMQGWTPFDVTSWNVGFQAEVYSQKGGSIPTITWQSTITQSIPNGPTATTNFTNILEFDYAFDTDETRGLLTGMQETHLEVATALASIRENIIGYVGGYYQWPNNWKFTGRIGVQSFGGAQILNLTPIQPFTQPIVRLDIDQMDDDDNRLFGVTAEIMWLPKPAYELTLRTPIFFTKN
jgi:hypothetical protein